MNPFRSSNVFSSGSMATALIWALILAMSGSPSAARALDLVVPRDFETIGAALSVAQPGDTVVLYSGTYSTATGETFPLALRDGVALRGQGKEATVIDASGSGHPALRLFNAGIPAGVVVSDLQIRGGGGMLAEGGAVSLSNVTGGTVVLRRVRVVRNQAMRGGAVSMFNASLRAVDSEFEDNNGRLAGGGFHVGGPEAALALDGCALRRNTALQGSGGGIALDGGGTVDLRGTILEGNSARYGGGLAVEGILTATADSTGRWTAIRSNAATLAAGGLLATVQSALDLDRVAFEFNDAPQAPALRVSNSSLTMDRCTVAYHEANGNIVECIASNLSLVNWKVHRNESLSGGIVWLEDCWGDVAHATLVANSADAGTLHGTLVINGAPNPPHPILRIVNSIVAHNQGMGVVERTLQSDPELRNVLVHGNSRGYYTDEIFFVFTTAAAFQTLVNNAPQTTENLRVGDPNFFRPGHDDFRLAWPSDAIGQAQALLAPATALLDFDGTPRHALDAGSAWDLGAYESLAPRLQGPVVHYPASGATGTLLPARLLLPFSRPVRLAEPLTPEDFFLPVAGDFLPANLTARVDPKNPTHLIVALNGIHQLTVPGVFHPETLAPGSPSGIDLKTGAGTRKVVGAVLGMPALATDGATAANTAARDLGEVAHPPTQTAFGPFKEGRLDAHPTSLLPRTRLAIPIGSLFYDCTLRLAPVAVPRASFSAVRIEIVSGSPVIRPSIPARLTLQYDPAEMAAWGYPEHEVALFRLTEVARDRFEFVALDPLEGQPTIHDTVANTISMAIDVIVPPRPVFLSAEPYEGPMGAIYAVLPTGIRSGTVLTRSMPGVPLDYAAQVSLIHPDSLALTGATIAGRAVATGTEGIEFRVRAVDGVRELTGQAPRPSGVSPSGMAAFEASTVLANGVSTPLNSYASWFDVFLQLSDGIRAPYPTDFRTWDGTPVSATQLRGLHYDPFARVWNAIPPERTVYDAETRTLMFRGITTPIPNERTGLFAVSGDPDAATTLDFWGSRHGWIPEDATPHLPKANPEYADGLLKIRANDDEGYALWGAPRGAFRPSRDRMVHLAFEVVTDSHPWRTPSFGMRANSGDWQRMSSYVVNGIATQKAAPPLGVPRRYHVFFQPSANSIQEAYDGDALHGLFNPYFEMIHFAPWRNDTGMVGLKTLRCEPFDMNALGPWSRRLTHDFADAASSHGWERFGVWGADLHYDLTAGPAGLRFAGGKVDIFAGIGVGTDLVLEPGLLYRVRYRLRADEEPSRIPSFRLRVGDTGFESQSLVVVDGRETGMETPAHRLRNYDVYYHPPQALAQQGVATLGCAFDYMNFDPTKKDSTAFVFESIVVDTAPWSP